jgi:spore coat protein H
MERFRWALCLVAVCCACTSDGPKAADEPEQDAEAEDLGPDAGPGSEALYPSDRSVEVAITLSDTDFDLIRGEGRSINEIFSGCLDPDFAYTEVQGSLSVDGHALSDVSIRKKGWLGSLSVEKPSFRLVLDRHVPGQNLLGQKDLTLNNSRSDASLLRTCLAYGVFEDAGIPAPRCALARVSLNGKDLGFYANVEPLKKPFLRRHFANASGNLYEGGSGADFRADSLDRFEKKTNESDPDHSELDALSEALDDEDTSSLETRLAEHIDLDQFLRFWAVESLVGHWDGYSGDLNNFFVYQDPSQKRLVFLPWGPDGAFQTAHPFLPAGERPAITYAWARLPRQLYANAAIRARYHDTLRELLASVWNEEKLLAKVDSLGALLSDRANPSALEGLRKFIRERRAQAEQELSADVPWTLPERPLRACVPESNTPLRARFVTQWDSLVSPSAAIDNTLEIELNGEPQVFTQVLAGAGPFSMVAGGSPSNALRLTGVRADGSSLTIQIGLAENPIAPGEITLHGFETFGFTLKPGTITVNGYIGEGVIKLEEAGDTKGAGFEGSIEAAVVVR